MITAAELGISQTEWDAISDGLNARLEVLAYPMKPDFQYQSTLSGTGSMQMIKAGDYLLFWDSGNTVLRRYDLVLESWDTGTLPNNILYSLRYIDGVLYAGAADSAETSGYVYSSVNFGTSWTLQKTIAMTSGVGVWPLTDDLSLVVDSDETFLVSIANESTTYPRVPRVHQWAFPIQSMDVCYWNDKVYAVLATEISGQFSVDNPNYDTEAEGYIDGVRAVVILFGDNDSEEYPTFIPGLLRNMFYTVVDSGNTYKTAANLEDVHFSEVDGRLYVAAKVTTGSKSYPQTLVRMYEFMTNEEVCSIGNPFQVADGTKESGNLVDDGTDYLWWIADESRKLYRSPRVRSYISNSSYGEADISPFIVEANIDRDRIQSIQLSVDNSMGAFNNHAVIDKGKAANLLVNAVYDYWNGVSFEELRIRLGEFYVDVVSPDISGGASPSYKLNITGRDKGRFLLGQRNSDDYVIIYPQYEKMIPFVKNLHVNGEELAIFKGAFWENEVASEYLNIKSGGGEVLAIHPTDHLIENFTAELEFNDIRRHPDETISPGSPWIGIVFHVHDARNYREVYLGPSGTLSGGLQPIQVYYREVRNGAVAINQLIATGSLQTPAPYTLKLAVIGRSVAIGDISGGYNYQIPLPSLPASGRYDAANGLAYQGFIGIHFKVHALHEMFPRATRLYIKELRQENSIINAPNIYTALSGVQSDVEVGLLQGGFVDVVKTAPQALSMVIAERDTDVLDNSKISDYQAFSYPTVPSTHTNVIKTWDFGSGVTKKARASIITNNRNNFGSSGNVSEFELYGSNDGSSWTKIGKSMQKYLDGSMYNGTAKRHKLISHSSLSGTAYRYYKVQENIVNSSSGWDDGRIHELRLYTEETPTTAKAISIKSVSLLIPVHLVYNQVILQGDNSGNDYYRFTLYMGAHEGEANNYYLKVEFVDGGVPSTLTQMTLTFSRHPILIHFQQEELNVGEWRHYIVIGYETDPFTRTILTNDVTEEWTEGYLWGSDVVIYPLTDIYPVILDPNESVMSALERSLDGRYYKTFMRWDNTVKMFIPKVRTSVLSITEPLMVNKAWSLIERAAHYRVRGAYTESDYFDADASDILNGYVFRQIDNPFLVTERECYIEAERSAKLAAENASSIQFDYRLNPFIEPEDVITINGEDYIIEAISINYQYGQFFANYAGKESQDA